MKILLLKIQNRSSRFLLPAIILFGAAVRFYEISRESLWYDELFPLWASRLPIGELLKEVPASRHPPLYYLIGHVWFAISTNDTWVRLISWTAGVFTIWLVYLLAKEMFSRRAGLWAATLAASSPYLFWYSREASDYSLLIAVSTASLYFLVRSSNRGGWANWTVYVITTSAALFTHFYAAFLLVAEAVFFVLIHDRRQRRLRPWLISEAALMGFVLLWMLFNRGAAGWVVFNLPDLKTFMADAFWRGPVALLWGTMPLNHAEVVVPYWLGRDYMQVAIVLLFLGMLALSAQFRKAFLQKKTLGLTVLILVLLAGPVLGQSLRETFTSVRYYALAITPLLLLITAFVSAAPRRVGTVIGSLAAAASLCVTGWTLINYHYDNWRGAMATVSDTRQAGDHMFCFPISECTMAAHHYLNDTMPVSGGFLRPGAPESVTFYPLGTEWYGYRTGEIYGKQVTLSALELENRVNQELQSTDRVWILAGDGSADDILRADVIYRILGKDWRQVGEWEYLPLVLKLYIREGNSGLA